MLNYRYLQMKGADFLLQCSEVHGSSSQQINRWARLVYIAHGTAERFLYHVAWGFWIALYNADFEFWIVCCARNVNCKV